MKQTITSKGTARSMVPAIRRFVAKLGLWKKRTFNVDLGGGPYELFTRALWYEHGVANVVIDPYNRSEEHNRVAKAEFEQLPADTGTLSNVLNVIPTRKGRIAVLREIKRLVKPDGEIFITVYEGDKSGKGRKIRDGWQENRRTRDYDEVYEVFGDVKLHGKLFVITTPGDCKE